MKVLYLDTETTGLDHRKHDIIQIAMLAEIDGQVVDELQLHIQPIRWNNIDDQALATHGIDRTTLRGEMYRPQIEALGELLAFLDRHVDKYDKADKFTPAGHNVGFDLDFIQAFMQSNGHKYGFGTYQNWQALDTRALANVLAYRDKLIGCPNMKLETLCSHFGIQLQAHDALADIKATRELMGKLINGMGL